MIGWVHCDTLKAACYEYFVPGAIHYATPNHADSSDDRVDARDLYPWPWAASGLELVREGAPRTPYNVNGFELAPARARDAGAPAAPRGSARVQDPEAPR